MIEIGNAQILGKRDNQEDYLATLEIGNGVLGIVADGMGGYEGGEIASKIVVKSFIKYFTQYYNEVPIDKLLLEATHYANENLEQEKVKNSSLEEMGCTLVAVYMTEDRLSWVSVGDSILYRYMDAKLVRLNADHSLAGEYQKQVDRGLLSQEEADAKPNRHALTSALTGYEIPNIEQSSIQIEADERFLITSDGIHSLTEKEIEELFGQTSDNQKIADDLLRAVEQKKLKNQDNTTVIILQNTVKNISINDNIPIKKKTLKTNILISIILVLLGLVLFLFYHNNKDKINQDTNSTQAEKILKQDVNISKDTNKSVKGTINAAK